MAKRSVAATDEDQIEQALEDLTVLSELSDVDVDRELAARSLREYIEIVWYQVEPSVPFQPNWHIDALCDHLEAVKAGEIDRLVINIPPGVGKSLLCCVFFPSWLWTDWAGAKVITSSYSEDVAKRDSLRTRNLIESQFWRERWGHQMTPNRSQWAAANFRNRQGGFRLAVGVGGSVTGEHANIQIVDDPLKPLEVTGKLAITKAALEKCNVWWDQTMPTRLVDAAVARVAARIIIMQRLHESDLSGRMLKDAGYYHLCLPMEYDASAKPCVISSCQAKHLPNADPRKKDGELLDPKRKPRKEVERKKRELGSRGTAAQLNQRPSPAEGTIFKRTGLRYYRAESLPRFDRVVQSWDMTFKEESTSYVCGQVWGQAKADCYLLAQRRDKWSMTQTCDQVRGMTLDWPKAYKKYVEAKANGPAVVNTLQNEISGFELVEPEGGKIARANACEPMWESGNVWLPHKDEQPWIEDFVEEVIGFPGAANDDQVDCMTQALIKLHRYSLDRLRRALENMANIRR